MDPVSTILGICIGQAWDITRDVTDSFAGEKLRTIAQTVRQRIVTTLPKNHDLIREVRRAELLAARKIATVYNTKLSNLPCHEKSPGQTIFATRLEVFLAERLKLATDSSIDFHTLTPRRINHVLDEMIDVSIIEGATATAQSSREKIENAFLAEIAKITDSEIPPDFRELFTGKEQDFKQAPPAWYHMVALFITEEIKTNERFKSIFFAAELVDIKHSLATVDARIAGFLSKGIPSLQSDLAELKGQLGDIKDDTTDIKADVKELLRIMKSAGVEQRAAEQGISPAAISNIVERLGGQGIEPDNLVPWLENWIESAVQELSRKSNEGEAYEAAYREAQRRFQSGRLAEASSAFMEEFARQEQREAERQQEHKRHLAALLEGAIRFDALARNEPGIINKLRKIARLQEVFETNALGDWYMQRGREFYEIGKNDYGTDQDLIIAIAAFRATLLERPRELARLEWATTQHMVGVALLTLGQREQGVTRLEEAVGACRAALEEKTLERASLDWAETQNSLGCALFSLGQKCTGVLLLEEALVAFHAAKNEWRREHTPLDWAKVNYNLGLTLWELYAMETGTVVVEEAVASFRAALEEWTRERAPLDWAKTQNALGAALGTLGRRGSQSNGKWVDRTFYLEQAITAHRAALLELTRERLPIYWAITQADLGHTFFELSNWRGTRQTDLEDALTNFDLCLSDFESDLTNWDSRDRLPDWIKHAATVRQSILYSLDRQRFEQNIEDFSYNEKENNPLNASRFIPSLSQLRQPCFRF